VHIITAMNKLTVSQNHLENLISYLIKGHQTIF